MGEARRPDVKHLPVVQVLLGDKYEDDDELRIPDWDGSATIACTCGWRESRIGSTPSLDEFAARWRRHVTAEVYGLEAKHP